LFGAVGAVLLLGGGGGAWMFLGSSKPAAEAGAEGGHEAPAKEEAYKYLDFILRPDVQEMMAKEFFTSPTNTKSTLDAALAKDVPVSGEGMKKIFQFDWSKVNPQVAAITDRWNREMK
ncbi:MAG: hypothetical protein EOO24_41700, partial [Comamonadaceae bacterium]